MTSLKRAILEQQPAPEVFQPALIEGLPEPARRYLLHALTPGRPAYRAVHLEMEGSMLPRPGAARLSLKAAELLAPCTGFVWDARARMGGLPVHIRDHYLGGDGGIRIRIAGLIPLPAPRGPDVARSSRGRLIAEAVWCPGALLGDHVRWSARGPDTAVFTLSVDGEEETVCLDLSPDGALEGIRLERWGDVVQSGTWTRHPYGFQVLAEGPFANMTIPTRIRGGWHFGSSGFRPEAAAQFTVRSVRTSPTG